MAYARDDAKNRVRERINIVEVVKRYVELKRAGHLRYVGLCPFHNEKTPSFNVNEQHQYFHCFGCQEGGDVFSFVMKVEGKSFPEALRDLAGQAGVEIEERPLTPTERKARQAAESQRERMLRTTEVATKFFEEQYAGPAGAAARRYVEGRGISDKIVAAFRVGYAPGSGGALMKLLASSDLGIAEAKALGLLAANERGHYDFFRDRVMLPVIDRQGRPVGFSSRLLDPDAKAAKYVNSPDSPLFHKKEQLYGLHAALGEIRKAEAAILVEGNFDVMSLHEAGITNAVAPMGTALTVEQVRLLGKLASKVIVVFDGDEAGVRASGKSIPMFVEEQIDARVARLPSGLDPDDFVRREGADAFRRLCDGARPALDQFIDDVAATADLGTIPGRVRALEEAAPLLGRVRNTTTRELYAGRLSATLQVSPQQVARALRSSSVPAKAQPIDHLSTTAQPVAAATAAAAEAVDPRTPPHDELEALVLLHAQPGLARAPEAARVGELLVDPAMRALWRSAVLALESPGGRLDVPAWLEAGPADVRAAVSAALRDDRWSKVEDPVRALRALTDKLGRLRVDAEIGMLERQHREAVARGDEAAARAIALRELELIRTKQGLASTPPRAMTT